MSLTTIRRIASAVQAGIDAARRGDVINPFDDLNEEMRLAYHFGWNTQQLQGERLMSIEQLVDAVTRDARGDKRGLSGHVAVR